MRKRETVTDLLQEISRLKWICPGSVHIVGINALFTKIVVICRIPDAYRSHCWLASANPHEKIGSGRYSIVTPTWEELGLSVIVCYKKVCLCVTT